MCIVYYNRNSFFFFKGLKYILREFGSDKFFSVLVFLLKSKISIYKKEHAFKLACLSIGFRNRKLKTNYYLKEFFFFKIGFCIKKIGVKLK